MNQIARSALILSLIGAHAAHPQDYTVEVKTVTVWIKAIDGSGNSAKQLKQEDFSITEDGNPVAVTCFEEEDSALPEAAAEVPTAAQKFVVFLDLYNTTPPEYSIVKTQLQDFVKSLSGKNQEVMLAALLPSRRMGVIAPFTKDLNRIRILLNKATANPMRDVITERRFDEIMRVFEGAAGDTLQDITAQIAHDIETLANQEKEESEFSLDALESFAGYLENQHSTEQIVMLLVSGGFSRDPGRRYYDIVDRLANRSLNNDALKFTGFKTVNFNFDAELRRSVGRLAKSNVTIYTLNTRGTIRRKEYQDSLIEISRVTGGIAFYNSLNFTKALGDVVQDLSHQYVLCYSAPVHARQSEYHKIKVTCKQDNVDLRYRNGYFD